MQGEGFTERLSEVERRTLALSNSAEKQGERLGDLSTTLARFDERMKGIQGDIGELSRSTQAMRSYITDTERRDAEEERREREQSEREKRVEVTAKRKDRISLAVAALGMLGVIAAAIITIAPK